MELADEIGIPTGFDELLKVTSGKKLKDVETVAKREKKGYEKEQAEINPRIDEIEKGCKGYATEVNTKEIDGKRNAVKMKIGQLDSKRAKLFGAEKERQQTIETINTLKRQQIERESALASDTSGVVGLVQEKAEMQTALNGINSDIQQQQISLASYVGDRDRALKRLNGIVSVRDQADVDIAAKVAKLTEAIENVVDTCPTCDRPLDESKIAEAIEAVKAQIETAKAKSKESIEAIQHDGNEAVADIKLAKTSIENVEAVIQNLSAKLEKTEAANADRIKEIDRLIHRNEPPAKENDNEWKVFALKIQGFEEKLGDSVADVLQGIDTERIGLLEEVAAYDMTLASGDRLAADKKRIDDYKAREKELAQLIADIDNRLEQIDQYGKAESELIEKAVNDKFKHVEFKLFKEFQNGEVEPYCVATYKGVSYPDLSTGQRIYIGVDIINVLSDHFDISVVLFIDHSESLTMPIEANSQVIKLQAAEGVKELVTVAT
jgi:chromosome segregation ATPase